ncbi:MAG: hypothetical protein HOV83_21700 [Catenulispora sp.]|nr:hypothetical protein [Catenulispora sp.]
MHDEQSSELGGRQVWRPFSGRAVGWWFLLVVAAGVVAANAMLASEPSPAHPREPAPGPDSRQGVSVAQREFGLLSGGGFAQAWTLWSQTARSALSQSDFVRSTTACRLALGVPYIIDSTAVVGTSVTITWHQASTKGVAGVVFEDGAWRFVPDPATLTAYQQGHCPAAR